MFEAYERGELELGGCCVTGNDPQLRCQGPNPHDWWLGAQGNLFIYSGDPSEDRSAE